MIGNYERSFFQRYDFSFFILSTTIFAVGLLNLYSATHLDDHLPIPLYKVQLGWFSISMVVAFIISFIRPKNWMRMSIPLYLLNILLLALVLVVGVKVLGAKRWLGLGPARIQPSEFMKIAVVLVMARWYSKVDVEKDIGLKELIIPFLLVFIPVLLIVVEPDLGTGLIVLLIFFTMTFYRRLKWKTIFILFLIGMFSSAVMYKFGLKEYQRQRIITFFDPWGDARGTGYNAIQSEIAIGSGKVLGKGYNKSTQASLSYLPENHTDFVFSIYNEEHGLLGALFLVILYVMLLLRYMWLVSMSNSFFDCLLAVGLMSILFWHTFINMAMVTGLLPIVGVPLPYMSYGGSSLLTLGISTGIATAISNSRNMF